MKKQYQQPDMEVVAINGASQMLAGSDKGMTVDGNSGLHGGGEGGTITGSNEPGRSDEYYDMGDDDLDW